MEQAAPIILHATAICMDGRGVVIMGPSGAGKSDLALRLIDRGAQLICDDIVEIRTLHNKPFLFQAPNIGGKIEIRGIGIIHVPAVNAVPCHLAIILDKNPERFHEKLPCETIAGFEIPALLVDAFEASAAIKVEYALNTVVDGHIKPVARSAP